MTGFNRYKKIIAKVILAAFFFVYFPFANSGIVYADPETGSTSGASTGATTESPVEEAGEYALKDTKVQTYSVNSDPAPSFTAFKGMSEWANRKVIAAPENTYVLTAATGASSGQNVLYFNIRYEDPDGRFRSQYVFPGIDAGSRSSALLSYYAKKNAKVDDIYKSFGARTLAQLFYKEEVKDDTTLGAWTVQDYAFQTDAAIAKVSSIDVYMTSGQWTVQGLALYKMTSFRGYEEYGLVSGQHFLDFEGYLIADLVKKNPGTLTLKTSKNDAMISIGGSDSLYFDIQNYSGTDHTRGYAVNDSLYSFRLDLADMEGASITAFQNADAVKIRNMQKIVEDITIEFQYKDRHGWSRKVALPFILSSFLMAYTAEGESRIYGFAQRGETIAFQGLLPEFDSVVSSVTMKIGETARKVITENGLIIGKKVDDAISSTAGSSLRIAGVSMYKGGCMAYVRGGTDSNGQHLDGASLEYMFESGEPMIYYTTTEAGQLINAGGSTSFTLRQYKSGNPIVARSSSKDDIFLVTIYTSDKTNAGNSGDVKIRLSYLDSDGDAGNTQTYSVKTAAESFLGPWPSTTGGSYIGQYGLQQGSSISFLVEAKNLQEFTNAEISNDGNDLWEMKNLTICYMESYSSRRAYLAPSTVTGTKFWITRDMVFAEIFNLAKTVSTITDENGKVVNGDGTAVDAPQQLVDENNKLIYDGEGKPVYVDEDQKNNGGYRITGGQLFVGGQTLNIDFGRGVASDVRDVDYSSVLYTMTYEQTQVDWGFFKKRKIYNVAVKVAKDSETDTGNGDAGSVNYFYFQLKFQNGNSGYVLANQQLAGDAFRSGTTAVFSIATNRDYGELQKINIVPEDLASDATPFDKLNIESITVSEQTTGGTNISYIFDQIGWIDIDYRDEAESSSIRGLKARSEAQLAKTYDKPTRERSVKLLCELSTIPWEGNYNQFQGSVWAEISYIKASDNSVDTLEFDVVQCLAAYNNKAAATMEAATSSLTTARRAEGQGAISDPDTMFRPGKTDRFVLPPISDLKTIKSIKFIAQTRNNEGAVLNISKVSISQILEDGPLQLTAAGEIYRNFKTKKFAINSESKVYSKTLLMGIAAEIGPIPFADNQLVWSSEQWATPVSRIPDSNDDTVNIYVYPTVSGGNVDNFYDSLEMPVDREETASLVHANLSYNIPYSQQMAAACDLSRGTDGRGHVLYYATGVKAANFVSAAKLAIQCTNTSITFNHAIVQHVKDDVVISTTSYHFFDTTAVIKLTAEPTNQNFYPDKTLEKLMLSFGSGTPDMLLQKVNNDIAVAFTYISSIDGLSKEYTSPYVYLTDQNVNAIREGLMAEIDFDVPYVRAITGYRIAAYGNAGGNITASAAVVYHVDKEENNVLGNPEVVEKSIRSYSSFMENFEITDKLVRHDATAYNMNGQNSLTPVSITFTSTEGAKHTSDGKDAAVRMNLTYNDVYGQTRQLRYEDIRKYVQGDDRNFGIQKPVTIRLFLQEMNTDMGIQSLELLPYIPGVDVLLPGATEPVQGADIQLDPLVTQLREGTGIFAGYTGDASETGEPSAEAAADTSDELARKLYEVRATSWTISKVDYDAGLGANIMSPTDVPKTLEGLANGGTLRMNTVSFTTYVAKNNAANARVVNHSAQLLAVPGDVVTGTVTIRGSRAGFTVKAYRMVGDAGEDVTEGSILISETTRSFNFYVPRNLTGILQVYRIDVSPVEAPDLVDSIFVSVESEGINLSTSLSLNGGPDTPVTDHHSILLAKGGDVVKAKITVENSTAGISVGAYRMVGEAGENVTNDTISNLTAAGFDFTVPENHTGSVVQYKIEVSPLENYEVKDTIYISVESTPEPEPDTTESTETPSSETPSSETPSSETPSSETPSSETPSSETPSSETPNSETPGSETPGSETPGSETPNPETPAPETPNAEGSGSETGN